MNKKHKLHTEEMEVQQAATDKTTEVESSATQNTENSAEEMAAEVTPEPCNCEQQIAEWQDKYLRLQAEFDNYRKRTLKEKAELIKAGGEDVLKGLLPVVDDLERALKAVDTAVDLQAVKEGIVLITSKFTDFLASKGVKAIEAQHADFDVDLHEAITKIPAPAPELKGKVVDVIVKGFTLNDKVIRYSKVVVGE